MITGLAHVNLTDLAHEFYGTTLGLTPRAVPSLQKETLAWFDIGTSGQQVHIAFGDNESMKSSRHPCFKLESGEKLVELQKRIWEHFEKAADKDGSGQGSSSAPREADRPGAENSGAKGVEYPQRFFARDYAGNRLEFSV